MYSVTRKKAFETNSSSTHSIVIQPGDFVPDKLQVKDGVCKIFTGEFNWGYECFKDAATKASYCLTYVKTTEDVDQADMLREVLLEVTKANTIEFCSNGDGYYEWGHIDHQSGPGDGDACGKAFDSKESLRNFIFNQKSILIIDNDNH